MSNRLMAHAHAFELISQGDVNCSVDDLIKIQIDENDIVTFAENAEELGDIVGHRLTDLSTLSSESLRAEHGSVLANSIKGVKVVWKVIIHNNTRYLYGIRNSSLRNRRQN